MVHTVKMFVWDHMKCTTIKPLMVCGDKPRPAILQLSTRCPQSFLTHPHTWSHQHFSHLSFTHPSPHLQSAIITNSTWLLLFAVWSFCCAWLLLQCSAILLSLTCHPPEPVPACLTLLDCFLDVGSMPALCACVGLLPSAFGLLPVSPLCLRFGVNKLLMLCLHSSAFSPDSDGINASCSVTA